MGNYYGGLGGERRGSGGIRPPIDGGKNDIGIENKGVGDQGLAGERAVEAFFEKFVPEVEVITSTEEQDSGIREKGGQAIDSIMLKNGEPIMAIQVTTARDSKVVFKKMQDMKELDFIPLRRKGSVFVVPRVQVFLSAENAKKYDTDPSFVSDVEMAKEIIQSGYSSLIYLVQVRQNTGATYLDLVQRGVNMFDSLAQQLYENNKTPQNRRWLGALSEIKKLLEAKVKKLGKPS